MPELRQDPVTGRWVAIAVERAKRPEDFTRVPKEEISKATCPFCPGNESLTPPEVYAIRPSASAKDSRGWQVRVVPNKFPAFSDQSKLSGKETFYKVIPALGAHEVIVHSPKHRWSLALLSPDGVEAVVSVYRERHLFYAENPLVKAIVTIINHGREAGASLEHSHSQLFAVPVIPPNFQEELKGVKKYQQEKKSCVFCQIGEHEIKARKRIIFKNNEFLAFCPYASMSPFEIWILPLKHEPSFESSSQKVLRSMAEALREVLRQLHVSLGDPDYNLWLHTRPPRLAQDYHWHLEIRPKLSIAGSFEWGSGMMINVALPEEAAEFLRQPSK